MTYLDKLWAGAMICLVIACSNADVHPAAGGGSSSSGVAGSPSTRPLTDAAADPDASCASTVQKGPTIAEMLLPGTPPDALGGTISPGTYVLSEADFYGPAPDSGAPTDGGQGSSGDGTTGFVARATIVVAGNTITKISARGPKTAPLPPDNLSASTFTIIGTSIRTTETCPEAGGEKTIPFSAVGGGLSFITDASHRELFTKE